MAKKEEKSLPEIEETSQEIRKWIMAVSDEAKQRLDAYLKNFNEEFPRSDPLLYGASNALTWGLMGQPLALFAIGLNGPAIIELHSILETFSTRAVIHQLKIADEQATLQETIQFLPLPKVASILLDMSIWNSEDVKFANRLSRLRNGLAHKNQKTISNVVLSGKTIPLLDIDNVMTKVDLIPFLIGTTKLLIKLMPPRKKTIRR